MRQFTLLGSLALFLFVAVAFAQDDTDAAQDNEAAPQGGDGGNKTEECEEAWEYVEYLKSDVKESIENILQETLFNPSPLLEQTVTDTMEEILVIRDGILNRIKALRTEEIEICQGQNINQEEFLTQIRMQIMAILLQLIEKDAASTDRLKDIGKQLLAIRTRVNSEITRMIMLRETTTTVTSRILTGNCDCGILNSLEQQLEQIVNSDESGNGTANGTDSEGSDDDVVTSVNMILMDVDNEIKNLYTNILSTLEDEDREKLSLQLQNIKAISTDLHEVLSKLAAVDNNQHGGEDGEASEEQKKQIAEEIERIVRRDVRTILNDVKRLLSECLRNCPGECISCGAMKIDEISAKLGDYKISLESAEETEAMESIRTDVMAYLTTTNSDMTSLLKEKAEAENGELDECGTQKLAVIDKIKGPLWMMVNITIFGDGNTMTEMIDALEQALVEIRQGYCGAENVTITNRIIDEDNCFMDEIQTSREFIVSIDDIISQNLFKADGNESRKDAMLALIDLKASMDDRVRKLFQENLQCKEEVEQIKNVYAGTLTECLSELMNPRYRFESTPRAQRVACIKELRNLMEDRRGELLMREIEARINEAGTGAEEGDAQA